MDFEGQDLSEIACTIPVPPLDIEAMDSPNMRAGSLDVVLTFR